MRVSLVSFRQSHQEFVDRTNQELHTLESRGKRIIDIKFSSSIEHADALIMYDDKEGIETVVKPLKE